MHIDNLLNSLITLIDYIGNRTDDMTEDDDLSVLESTGYHLQNMTDQEKELLLDYLNNNKRTDIINHFGL